MQRRAAALYLAFFVVVGAAAYGLLVTASAPHVSMSGDAYQQGEPVTLDERTYNVSGITASGTGTLAWVNESARLTESLANGSEVPVTQVSWEGQRGRTGEIANGSEVTYLGERYRVALNASESTMTFVHVDDANVTESFETEDTFLYGGNETTLVAVTAETATISWGGPYAVAVNNESVSNPTNATLVEQRDYEALSVEDPALYNGTVRQDGVLKVTYRANETNVAVEEYFGPKERHLVRENGTLVYNGNETTVTAISNESVDLAWPGTQTEEIELAEGENFTAGVGSGTQYFTHFPDNTSVQIFETDERYDDYAAQKAEISSYESRKLGLWGVAEISALAVVILLMAAYLPTRG